VKSAQVEEEVSVVSLSKGIDDCCCRECTEFELFDT
jgi:hypothetical protein